MKIYYKRMVSVYRSVERSVCSLRGETGKLINGITDKWLMGIRESNPAILDMFKERDKRPYRRHSAWAGEFAGRSSVYVGPVLYGVDASDNCLDGECVNAFSEDEIRKVLPERKSDGSIRASLSHGRVLKDFYHLGYSGSWYTTWLNIE